MKICTGEETTGVGRMSKENQRTDQYKKILILVWKKIVQMGKRKIKKQESTGEQIGDGFARILGKLGKLNSQD